MSKLKAVSGTGAMPNTTHIPTDAVLDITVNMGNAASPKVSGEGKDSTILIVGGGTWGISIAYRLAQRGYTNITVLDPNDIFSSVAAGNDLNKILEERKSQAPVCGSCFVHLLTVLKPYRPHCRNKTTIPMHGQR